VISFQIAGSIPLQRDSSSQGLYPFVASSLCECLFLHGLGHWDFIRIVSFCHIHANEICVILIFIPFIINEIEHVFLCLKSIWVLCEPCGHSFACFPRSTFFLPFLRNCLYIKDLSPWDKSCRYSSLVCHLSFYFAYGVLQCQSWLLCHQIIKGQNLQTLESWTLTLIVIKNDWRILDSGAGEFHLVVKKCVRTWEATESKVELIFLKKGFICVYNKEVLASLDLRKIPLVLLACGLPACFLCKDWIWLRHMVAEMNTASLRYVILTASDLSKK